LSIPVAETSRWREAHAPVRISIAMCVHQNERFIDEQLASFAAQRRRPDELVVTDDGAGPETMSRLIEFSRRAPFPVRIHRNRARLGMVRNFERAISLASGDVIFLSDADDVWLPEKIRRTMDVLEADPPAAAAFCNSDVVDEDLQPRGYTVWDAYLFAQRDQRRLAHGDGLDVLLRHNVVGGNTLAFRAAFRDLILPIPTEWIHDQWIPLLIAAVADVRLVPERLLLYRQHSGQMVGAELLERSLRDVITEKRNGSAEAYVLAAGLYQSALDRIRSSRDRYPPRKGAVASFESKIRHSLARARIWQGAPRFRLLAQETLRLNYHRYSRGWKSIAVDALLA
jgi:glycosyltransferase involved in cell wall biosynthesis